MKVIDPDVRFWPKVRFIQGPSCWLWDGARNSNGYGTFFAGPGRHHIYAHRWAYEQAKGPIPPGLVIDHLCRTPACVNPDHLEAVTHRENIVVRGTATSARHARQTHCVHGHEFTPENTYLRTDHPGRMCRTCKRRRDAARYRASVHKGG